MNVRYSLSRRDLFSATVSRLFRNWWFWLAAVLFGGGAATKNTLEILRQRSWEIALLGAGAMLLVAVLMFFVMLPVFLGTITCIIVRKEFLGERWVSLTVDGVDGEMSFARTSLPWSRSMRVWRTKRLIGLDVANQPIHLVPRRAFADEAAFAQFFQTCVERIEAAGTLDGGKP